MSGCRGGVGVVSDDSVGLSSHPSQIEDGPAAGHLQPASPSSMLAHIAVIGRDCRGILDHPLAVPAHQDQREHPQGRLGVQISPARYHI